jgi:serine/threonine protein kinase
MVVEPSGVNKITFIHTSIGVPLEAPENVSKSSDKTEYVELSLRNEAGNPAAVFVKIANLVQALVLLGVQTEAQKIQQEATAKRLEYYITNLLTRAPSQPSLLLEFDPLYLQRLAVKVKGVITVEHMQEVIKYVNAQRDLLESKLAEERSKPGRLPFATTAYVLLKKMNSKSRSPGIATSLPVSVEYHGKHKIRIRFKPNFAKGKFKTASKQLDIHRNIVFVKSKSTLFPYVDFKHRLQSVKESFIENEFKYSAMMNLHPHAIHLEDVASYTKQDQQGREVRRAAFYSQEAEEGELFDQVEKLTLVERVEMLRDAAHALGYLNAKGVVHRDVKLENIFITLFNNQKRALIGDFGFAGTVEEIRSRQLAGSPMYMAPEGWEGRYSTFGVALDSFALGVCIYCCWKLKSAPWADFQDGSPHFMSAIKNPERYLKNYNASSLELGLQEVIRKLWMTDPSQRITTGRAAIELDTLLPPAKRRF